MPRTGFGTCWHHTVCQPWPSHGRIFPIAGDGSKPLYGRHAFDRLQSVGCFPGQDRLAKDVGKGTASVNRFIKELESCSLIEITRRGQGRTNFYTLNFVVKKQIRKL